MAASIGERDGVTCSEMPCRLKIVTCQIRTVGDLTLRLIKLSC